MKGSFIILSVLFLPLALGVVDCEAQPPDAEHVIQVIETRPGVMTKFFYHTHCATPKGTILIFPGGQGEGHFSSIAGQITLGTSFLVRISPLFVDKGYAVAILDVPSDHAGGISAAFRTSPEHAQDVRKVVDFLARKNRGPIYLVGVGWGTMSVAYLATVLKEDSVKSIVLTSTLGGPHFVGSLPLEKISVPVLLVHHRDDHCHNSAIDGALGLKGRFKGSPRVDFVEIQGGVSPEDSEINGQHEKGVINPCTAMTHHGFIGVEDKAVTAITNWLSAVAASARIKKE